MTKPPPLAPPLALTMGEPAGVGAEITAKAWTALRAGGPPFFVIDDPARYEPYAIPVTTIDAPGRTAAIFPDALPVLPIGRPVDAVPGAPSPDTATAVTASIERAVALCLEGAAGGVITNPIQNSVLNRAGFNFPGHTEFLGALTAHAPLPYGDTHGERAEPAHGGAARGPVMMLAGPEIRTIPVTVHESVRDAANNLTTERIVLCARVAHEALKGAFAITSPRIAISGLNPHAGEDGQMGSEDRAIIAPAVQILRAEGIDARGPLPADTMFHARARTTFDVALCMLHDQALIPVKTLDFDRAVNVTLGLPIIRTSPDHGTALDIAGKGIARADSLIAAITLAGQLADELAARCHD